MSGPPGYQKSSELAPLIGNASGGDGTGGIYQTPQESTHPGALASCLLCCSCVPTMGTSLLASLLQNPVQTETIVMRWGGYERTIREPGLTFSNSCGRSIKQVSTKVRSMDLPRGGGGPRRTVLDAVGNPLIVSGVVVYRVVDSYRAALCVDNADLFVMTQGESMLKEVVAQYPYESEPGSNAPSLRESSDTVTQNLTERLQSCVHQAGIVIESFRLKEISYAPVIAQAMLKRQQAKAIISARNTIVTGAVDIAHAAVEQLKQKGIVMDQPETTKLVSNLLTVICAESEVNPVVPVG